MQFTGTEMISNRMYVISHKDTNKGYPKGLTKNARFALDINEEKGNNQRDERVSSCCIASVIF